MNLSHSAEMQNNSSVVNDSQQSKLVSAVVLSYNRCEETRTCLQSLLKQTYPAVDILVLDNGSRDGSVEMLRAEFPQLRLVFMPKNYGDWEGRDIASRNCDGDYLFFVDNDAFMPPDTIEKLVERMEREPELGVVQARVVDPDTGIPEGAGFSSEVSQIEHYRATFLGGAALIRTDMFRKAGGFPHYLLGGGEMFLSMRLLDMGYRVLHYPATIIFHRRSLIDRTPGHRYYLGTKQRIRAVMTHYPGFFRPMFELFGKIISYSIGAFRRKLFLRLPYDLPRLMYWGLKEYRGPWTIKPETVNLIDYLHTNVVSTIDAYAAIPRKGSYFGSVLRRRLIGTPQKRPAATESSNAPSAG